MPPDPPSLVHFCKLDIHVTPLRKILATGLKLVWLESSSASADCWCGLVRLSCGCMREGMQWRVEDNSREGSHLSSHLRNCRSKGKNTVCSWKKKKECRKIEVLQLVFNELTYWVGNKCHSTIKCAHDIVEHGHLYTIMCVYAIFEHRAPTCNFISKCTPTEFTISIYCVTKALTIRACYSWMKLEHSDAMFIFFLPGW